MTCKKTFSPTNTVKSHEVTHNGVKEIKYIICEKIFSHASNLKTYELTQIVWKTLKVLPVRRYWHKITLMLSRLPELKENCIVYSQDPNKKFI